MELSPRHLAFLEHEMTKIKDNRSRSPEDRKHASAVLGRIEGDIELAENHHSSNPTEIDAKKLFS